MVKYCLILLNIIMIINTFCIRASDTLITGGGGSETVAIVVNNNQISGKIITDQVLTTSTYSITMYRADYIPYHNYSTGKQEIIPSSDLVFAKTIDSGTYNLIVTNVQNGKKVIFQDIRIENGQIFSDEKNLTPSGVVKVVLKYQGNVNAYIAGTPFCVNISGENSATIDYVPEGNYTIKLLPNDEVEVDSLPSQFTVKSNETAVVVLNL